MIKACIFDLDGTLLDTLTTIHYYLNRTLMKHGYGSITREECRTFIGDGARVLVARALSHLGTTDEEAKRRVYDDYNAAYDAEPYYLTEAFFGIPELLAALSERGILLGVLSNKPHSATRPLVKRFFGDTVQTVQGGCEGIPLKPDPTVLHSMLERLGVSPEELIYVGDSGVDMQTGKNVGAALTVGVLWGFRDRDELIEQGADALINEPKELLNLIINPRRN